MQLLPTPDSVERFHISAFVLFVLAQNILEAEGPWFESFLSVSLAERIFKIKNVSCITYWFANRYIYFLIVECSTGLHL